MLSGNSASIANSVFWVVTSEKFSRNNKEPVFSKKGIFAKLRKNS